MSRFPRLDLSSIEQGESPRQIPPPQATPTLKRLLFLLPLATVGCLLPFLLYPSQRHMQKLKCHVRSDGYYCEGKSTGDILIRASQKCLDFMYDINGFPFSVAERTKNAYRVRSKKRIRIKDANPNCQVDIYWDSLQKSETAFPFTWITTEDHTEFTVYKAGEVLLDRIAEEFISQKRVGKWIAYTYDADYVTGNGKTPIWQFSG